MKLRMKKETHLGNELVRAGEFIEVSEEVGKDLVETGRAEQKTREEASAEDLAAGQAAQKAAWEAERARENARVTVIGDRRELDPRGGFKRFSHFLKDVHRAGAGASVSEAFSNWSQRAVGADDMLSSIGSTGGFLVPPEFSNQLLSNALEESIVRPRATPVPMSTSSITFPYINETTRASSTHGGVAPAGRAETTQMTGTKPALGKCTLTLNELYGFAFVSETLMEDSPISIEPLITKIFSEAISFEEDDRFIWGTGAGQPLGMFNAACKITVSKETGQIAKTIVFENIAAIWSRMHPAGQRRCIWLANGDCFPQISQLHIKVGTGGVPVWLPSTGAAGTPNGTIFGRPLILTEKCQTLGTLGDIALIDPAEYLVGYRAGADMPADAQNVAGMPGLKIATSIHLRFDYAEKAFRFQMRHDGQPWWSAAVTPRRSSNTLSPIVVLEARA